MGSGRVGAYRWANGQPQIHADFRPDYEPQSDYFKVVNETDARELAASLRRVAAAIDNGRVQVQPNPGPVLLRDDMTQFEHSLISGDLDAGFLQRLAAFVEQGQFAFAWDD